MGTTYYIDSLNPFVAIDAQATNAFVMEYPQLVQYAEPVGNIPVAAHHDVVVARIVHDRIARVVVRDLQTAARRLERLQVLRRVIVIVKIDDAHGGTLAERL